jgi:histidine ammonia-lyase
MILLDGSTLTIEQLLAIADRGETVALADEALACVPRAPSSIDGRAATSRPTASTPASAPSPT